MKGVLNVKEKKVKYKLYEKLLRKNRICRNRRCIC
jgi:hypothetical protein